MARRRYVRLCVKELETRTLLSASALDNVVVQPFVTANVQPLGLFGYTPPQISKAYGFDQISFNGTPGNGAGVTIAIVDAYHDPHIANDVQTFDNKYGIPNFNSGPGSPTFTEVDSSGGTNYPVVNHKWCLEISLDVEWAHAMAPGANILLVDATTANIHDMIPAVDYAAAHAQVVSMSWGANEFAYEVHDDSHFAVPGVTFVAAAGDNGPPPLWPSVSPNVLAVGGTTLRVTRWNAWSSESAWNKGGGGISAYEPQPAYQSGVVTQTTTARTTPDVAYNANLNTGYAFFDTVPYFGLTGWDEAGGTSAGAPQWSALVAIADQGRALLAKPPGSLTSGTQTLPALYGLYAAPGTAGYTTYTTYFHDITSGNNGFAAGQGYDLATGLGSPFARRIVSALIKAPTPPASSAPSSSGGAGQNRDNNGSSEPSFTLPVAVSDDLAGEAVSRQADAEPLGAFVTPSSPPPIFMPPPPVSAVPASAETLVAQAKPAAADALPQLSSGYERHGFGGTGLSPDGAAGFGSAPAVMPQIKDDADVSTNDPSASAAPVTPTADTSLTDEDWNAILIESALSGPVEHAAAASGAVPADRLPPTRHPIAFGAAVTALLGTYLRAHTTERAARQRQIGPLS
jgi:hypothetical protein